MAIPQTKSRYAYEQLREQIIAGGLAPGERLRLRALAESLGLSEMPVREALRMLSRDGLVAFADHRGATVTEIPLADVRALVSARMWLELLAVREAVPRHDEASLEAVRTALAEGAAAGRRGVQRREPAAARGDRGARAGGVARDDRRGVGPPLAGPSRRLAVPARPGPDRGRPRQSTSSSWRPSSRATRRGGAGHAAPPDVEPARLVGRRLTLTVGALEPVGEVERRRRVDADAALGQVLADTREPEFAADARLLPAAERRLHLAHVVGVDPHVAELELPRDASTARLMSDVHTDAPRPYRTPFASSIASSSESTPNSATTGPKISSRAAGASGRSPATTVGCRYWPSTCRP